MQRIIIGQGDLCTRRTSFPGCTFNRLSNIFRAALNDTLAGRFYSSPGLFLTGLNAAATDASLPAAGTQALLAGPMRLAAWGMQRYFQYVVGDCQRRTKQKTQ